MSEHVRVVREAGGAVVEVRFDRPERKNALTLDMYTAATDALVAAREDDTARVVVFRGEGGSFTSGNDLGDFIQSPPSGPDSPVYRFLMELVAFPKPIVAAVEGHAVGIGTTMLLHCDLIYAATSASFRLPFINLALVPEAASSLLLPGMMGHPRAAELLLLGEAFDAAKARELGIVNEVFAEPEALYAHAEKIAGRLARKPPTALRESKRLMKQHTQEAVLDAMSIEAGVFSERLQSPELMEAVSAFFEKRKPDFGQFS